MDGPVGTAYSVAMTRTAAPDQAASIDAPPPGFGAMLRARTGAVHREAERTGFIADLIRGRATREGYALYLRSLVPVYDALETALAAATAAPFAPFKHAGLHRGAALRADLAAIAGAGWAGVSVPSEAQAYARDVAAAAGGIRLLAHAYARYLGDLSGGQILKPVLARTLGLAPEALAVYDFPGLPSIEAHRTAIRTALDMVDAASAEAVAAEAVSAFRHNIAVSRAVQAAAG